MERTSGVLILSHIVVLNASFGGSMTCPKFYFSSPIFITIGRLILKTLSRHMYALAQNDTWKLSVHISPLCIWEK